MSLDLWPIYLVAAGPLACVMLWAWDRRRSAQRGSRLQKRSVDIEAALKMQGTEYAKQARRSPNA